MTTASGAREIPLRPTKDAYYLEEGRQIYGWEIEPCPVCARTIANAGIEAVVTEPR